MGDYEGDSYPEVVDWREIRLVDEPPPGTRVIGVASGEASNTTTTSGSPTCSNLDTRATRRMKRAAAFEGGEFLVDVSCWTTAHPDMSSAYDDPDTSATEYCLHCRTSCDAEVARHFSHDANVE